MEFLCAVLQCVRQKSSLFCSGVLFGTLESRVKGKVRLDVRIAALRVLKSVRSVCVFRFFGLLATVAPS